MKIEHVALYVKNLEEAKRFFVKYFDAKPGMGYYNPKTGFRSYFLSFENGAPLEIMNKPDVTEGKNGVARMGYSHVAFSVGSAEKVDELTGRLKADGYKMVSGPRVTGDGYYESCILDLEGNEIEVIV